MLKPEDTRIERDSMGEMQVPGSAYYGASTQRAVLNFPISDLRFPREFIRALGQIKQAAAEVNVSLANIDSQLATPIKQAAQEVIDGKLDDHFVLDIFQTGSGTSTNMNANEVIANRASELLGGSRGSRTVHPNDHVNFGQSSNDVIPSAIHLAAAVSIEENLLPALDELRKALSEKAQEFYPVIKTGRTHLQDATPIRLGQEFEGYVGQIERGLQRIRTAQNELSELALGGTAVGTGINTHPEFSARVCQELTKLSGISVRETSNHFQAQSTLDNIVAASGALNALAVSLMKIANDIRWLGSGPRAGFGELELPAVQPGSSIMPGKVNPVIAESVCMVCAQVMGNHTTITVAGQSGNFEINVMMPVAAYNLLQSIKILAEAARNFSRQCIVGLKATPKGPEMVEQGLSMCTSLAPVIGYDAAAAISKEAHKTGRTVREVARERTPLSEEDLTRILDPVNMTRPGLDGGPAGG
ncbi:class II fumarate hydratase [Tengunoibacter tsumagoiensis]|uniref:Fumarate hydratase class II n=1 Tax=Tengunoibacter tsumagoiensis TaxID=2014871 RepID=A0A401ZUQ8_9CHLR|nr:class II fumarate hydratase [Tengunoibacter tsumagoiensis]GCE10649.1 fumarate hydratase class II [Tengunoibacter tsumagoiensis]